MAKAFEPWEQMLDEYALHQDPMPWYRVKGLRMSDADQFDGVLECVKRGFLERAGSVKEEWKDVLYRITDEGLSHWTKFIRGKRTRPSKASEVPRWRRAQLAAAYSPTSVFDLARVPYRWDKKAEQMKEFGECEKS